MISSEHHAMLTTSGNLVGRFYTTVTQDATVHVQLDFVS